MNPTDMMAINLNEATREYMQVLLGEMDADPLMFNQNVKQEAIKNILNQQEFWASPV
jgi:hypothetical protein